MWGIKMKNKFKKYEDEWKIIRLGEAIDISEDDEESSYWNESWVNIYIKQSKRKENEIKLEPDIYLETEKLTFESRRDVDDFIKILKQAKKYLPK